jgi:hypothetical protein
MNIKFNEANKKTQINVLDSGRQFFFHISQSKPLMIQVELLKEKGQLLDACI